MLSKRAHQRVMGPGELRDVQSSVLLAATTEYLPLLGGTVHDYDYTSRSREAAAARVLVTRL